MCRRGTTPRRRRPDIVAVRVLELAHRRDRAPVHHETPVRPILGLGRIDQVDQLIDRAGAGESARRARGYDADLATGAIAVLLALVANGPINALIMLLAVLLVQQIESNLLQPLVMGKAVSLHPLAVVLVVTLGSLTLGIVGALFAVPFLAILNTVVRYLASRAWEDDPNIRTEPYLFPWEKKRAEKKSASEKVKARLKARSAQDESCPWSSSRLISRPTNRKNTAIRASLIQCSTERPATFAC